MMNYEILLLAIIFISCMLYAPIRNKRQSKHVLDELKRIKELFEKNGEFEYIASRIITKIIYGFVVVIFLNPVAISAYLNFKFKGWLELVVVSIFMLLIDIIIIKYLFKIINKGIKSIKIKERSLIIKYNNDINTYDIYNIDKLYIRIVTVRDEHTRKSVVYLYIKSKGIYKYDEYRLTYYTSKKIKALAILLEYIKNNNINAIDTLTKEEVEEFVNKLKIMNINEQEIRHII